MDEPTVIGRRPVGPARNTQVGQSSACVAPNIAFPTGALSSPVSESDEVWAANHAEIVVQSLFEPKAVEDVLVAAATPLFSVVAQLRIVDEADIGVLRRVIVEQIRRFEARVAKDQVSDSDVTAARYVICALLDEAVMTTRWGRESAWSDNSLLNQFHNETWGGEKVFQILERVQAKPAKYLALLKLINICLLMGFEGKYRVVEGGRERLEDLRSDVRRLLRDYTSEPPAELSIRWRGAKVRTRVRRYMPLWIIFTAAAVSGLIGYGVFRWRLSDELAPVEQLLVMIGQSGPR
ncbi:DotU family type IV/VI secretion system protein [Bradyrhizobium sp. Pear77]|uniref:type IVB secretion system protein IcmH/DotU n=1 Tax=Bradyrhizobium TaxID=374 RepID=UPI001E57F12F|nr:MULTISPECIES: type IVB secretion system protein IcmH/DotU [Bradyrhizobium]MCC8955315.1 DotU family type IV/VI secretion system protein [Bradyrhizobium altum]MCC8965056.1 DotU family type IV/VI secretion system protein [Bradyrhizobium oropedii]